MSWRLVTLPLLGLLAAGCAVSTVDLRDSLDLNQSSFRDKLAAKQDLIDAFTICTARPYDERSPAPAARSVPDAERAHDGPLSAIHALIARVKEGRPSQGESLQVLEETLADWKGASYGRLDLRKLRKVVDVIKQWHGHFDFDEDALAEDESRFARLLLAYNKAYFGDIQYTVGRADGTDRLRAAGADRAWGTT